MVVVEQELLLSLDGAGAAWVLEPGAQPADQSAPLLRGPLGVQFHQAVENGLLDLGGDDFTVWDGSWAKPSQP